MNSPSRPRSTHLKHRCFCIDKKSTVSTKQTSRSPAKSVLNQSFFLSSTQKIPKLELMSQSTPIQIYFNPQFRGQYLKKVVDSFFTSLKPQSKFIEQSHAKNIESSNKLSLRSRMRDWKRKNKIISNLSQINTGNFIRSSPQKSILSDLSEQKSLAVIDQNNIRRLEEKSIRQSDDQLISNLDQISIKPARLTRPHSEQNKKRKAQQSEQKNQKSSVTVSLFFNEGNSPREKMRKQVRKLIYSNGYFQEYAVHIDGKITMQIRKYLKEDNPLYKREQKLYKRGMKTLWKPSKFPLTLEYPLNKSIKQLISQQFKYGYGQLDSYVEIYAKPYYKQLFLNRNQELIDIMLSMTKFIIKNKGKVLTNSFNVKNLYKKNQKQFYLKDLGSSAIVEEITIRDRTIKHLYQPVWKQQGQNGKWIVRPEYLSPELLQAYMDSEHKWIEEEPETVMASQIWSLGCMILELLTLIPLNSDVRCRVKTNPQNLRRGFLAINFKQKNVDFELLQRKQKSLYTILAKKLEPELQGLAVEKKVVQVLKKMLIYDPKGRIRPEQVLSELKY